MSFHLECFVQYVLSYHKSTGNCTLHTDSTDVLNNGAEERLRNRRKSHDTDRAKFVSFHHIMVERK